jgi:hypothetical protein
VYNWSARWLLVRWHVARVRGHQDRFSDLLRASGCYEGPGYDVLVRLGRTWSSGRRRPVQLAPGSSRDRSRETWIMSRDDKSTHRVTSTLAHGIRPALMLNRSTRDATKDRPGIRRHAAATMSARRPLVTLVPPATEQSGMRQFQLLSTLLQI